MNCCCCCPRLPALLKNGHVLGHTIRMRAELPQAAQSVGNFLTYLAPCVSLFIGGSFWAMRVILSDFCDEN